MTDPGPPPEPLVSVIVATCDRPDMLAEALASIRAQELDGGIEVVVVDDASSPESLARVRALVEEDGATTLLENEVRAGPGSARNRALEAARGRYVAVLDDDDIVLPGRFAAQVAVLEDDRDVGVVCSLAEWVDDAGEVFATWPAVIRERRWPSTAAEVHRLLLVEGNKVPHSTVVARAEVLRTVGYATDLRVGEDWLLWLLLSGRGVHIAALPEPTVRMRRGRDHDRLMLTAPAESHRLQREVLRRARADGLPDERGVWRAAWSHQLARESAALGGAAAVGRSLRAVATAPLEREGWTALGRALRRVTARISRRSG